MARSYAVDLNRKNELFRFAREGYEKLCVDQNTRQVLTWVEKE